MIEIKQICFHTNQCLERSSPFWLELCFVLY
jgi:hypothetical protein